MRNRFFTMVISFSTNGRRIDDTQTYYRHGTSRLQRRIIPSHKIDFRTFHTYRSRRASRGVSRRAGKRNSSSSRKTRGRNNRLTAQLSETGFAVSHHHVACSKLCAISLLKIRLASKFPVPVLAVARRESVK